MGLRGERGWIRLRRGGNRYWNGQWGNKIISVIRGNKGGIRYQIEIVQGWDQKC